MSTDDDPTPDDALTRALATAAPPARASVAARREVAELSERVEEATRPRLRRSVRVAIGLAAGALALGGVSTAAAGPIADALDPGWRGDPDRVFVITLDSGVSCHIRTSVLPADPSVAADDPQLITGRQILHDLDLKSLSIVVDPGDASGPGPGVPVKNRPDPQLMATTSAISSAIFAGLASSGVYDDETPARISVANAASCGDEKLP